MEHVNEAAVDIASWELRRHELHHCKGSNDADHKAQSMVIEKNLDDVQKRIKDAGATAQSLFCSYKSFDNALKKIKA